jgi:hypothetical protein
LGISLERLMSTFENVGIARLALEILAGLLPDTSQELYRWTDFLGCLDQLNYC